MERMKLSELPQSLNWLLYADPGNTKTSLAATMALCPDMMPMLHLNVDGGLLTIRDMEIPDDQISVVDITNTDEFEALYHELKKEDGPFSDIQSICIDNGTELMSMALEEQIRGNLNRKSKSGKKRSSLDDAWIEDRSAAGNRIGRLFRWYRDLPQHVVYTAHVRREYPKKENMPDVSKPPLAVEPDFPPALSRRMRGYVDFVWYLVRNNDQVSVITQPRGPYFAKTRGVRLMEQFGLGFKWPVGYELMPALYETIINKKDFPLEVIHRETPAQEIEEEDGE